MKLALASLALMLLPSLPAQAQSLCAPFPTIADTLKQKYGEEQIGGAVIGETAALVVFAAPDGKTFTILAVDPAGLACILAAGKEWDVAQPPKGEPS